MLLEALRTIGVPAVAITKSRGGHCDRCLFVMFDGTLGEGGRVRGRSRRVILGHHARTGTPVLSSPWQLVLIQTQMRRYRSAVPMPFRPSGCPKPCGCRASDNWLLRAVSLGHPE